MKNVLFALFAVAFVTSLCFSEEVSVLSSENNSVNPTPVSKNTDALAQVPSDTLTPTPLSDNITPVATDKISNFTGKVDSKSSGYGMGETNPQFIVKDDNGQLTTFMVANDATIIGKDGNPTTLDWIGQDDKVNIEYITNQDGTKTAKSIKALVGL